MYLMSVWAIIHLVCMKNCIYTISFIALRKIVDVIIYAPRSLAIF